MILDNSKAIYRQIIDDFKKKIVRGELQAGDRIPSQREYAQTVRVNPNTVQRAYREMETMQMVETLRGQGTFICTSQNMKDAMKQEMASELLEYFIVQMRSIGFTDAETVHELQQAMESKGGNGNDSV